MSKYLPANTYVPGLVYFAIRDAQGNRVPRCGEVEEYHDDTAKAFEAGKWIVKDYITGNLVLIPFGMVTDANPGKKLKGKFGLGIEFEILDAWREVWAEYFEAVDDSLTEFGVGATFAIGVGDGSANYVVTKVTKTKAHVEWIGICGDDWHDHHFGYGGVFGRKEVERHCRRFGQEPLFGGVAFRHADHRTWFDLEKAKLVPEGMVPKYVTDAIAAAKARKEAKFGGKTKEPVGAV